MSDLVLPDKNDKLGRSKSRPSLLLFQNVPRRFGHAATDRQTAYMTNEEIQSSAERDPLGGTFVRTYGSKLYMEQFTNQFSTRFL